MDNNFIKIINATYKLLDFFPEGDPLKNKAKEKTLLIMEKLAAALADSTLDDDIGMLQYYLELARAQGWIHDINFLIVKKEWELIKKQIPNSQFPIPNKNLDDKKLKTNEIFSPKVRPKGITSENYSDRQEKILKILNRKKKVQVQDIIKEMPNVTKRTIRRDLDDLLKKGKITRMGEFNQVVYQKIDGTHLIS